MAFMACFGLASYGICSSLVRAWGIASPEVTDPLAAPSRVQIIVAYQYLGISLADGYLLLWPSESVTVETTFGVWHRSLQSPAADHWLPVKPPEEGLSLLGPLTVCSRKHPELPYGPLCECPCLTQVPRPEEQLCRYRVHVSCLRLDTFLLHDALNLGETRCNYVVAVTPCQSCARVRVVEFFQDVLHALAVAI